MKKVFLTLVLLSLIFVSASFISAASAAESDVVVYSHVDSLDDSVAVGHVACDPVASPVAFVDAVDDLGSVRPPLGVVVV